MALLRKSTLPGSITRLASGSRPVSVRNLAPAPSASLNTVTTGAMPKNAPSARPKPRIPAEKLSTSISNPARILPAHSLSTCFMSHAASGPTIIAPMNIGMSVPTMTPIVAMLATTPPRVPYTMRPPVLAMRSGSK